MTHALITFIFCLLCPDSLYFIPTGFYLGREIAQAEYRVIEKYYNRKRDNMPWYAPFTPKAWTMKSIFDWVLPFIISLGFQLYAILYG